MSATPTRRVLAADDDGLVRDVYRSFFASHLSWQLVGEARNGQEAVEAYGRLLPDLVLMDLQMPVMDGYEAARRIRALHDPQLSAIPIVTMTANALAQDLERERACGVSRHLSKPIDLTALHAALCEVLREN